MKQLHCDGCGFTEPTDLAKHKIKPVTLSVEKDESWQGTETYEADLCPNCRGLLLHAYFKIPAEGKLKLPAFIGPDGPKMLEQEPEPTSFASFRRS